MSPDEIIKLTEKKPIRGLAFFFHLLGASVLMGLMLITCIDVFGRYFFNNPLTGSTELTEMALSIVIFSVLPVISWRNEHVVVDILDRFVSVRVKFLRALLINVLSAVALIFVGYRIFVLADRSLGYGEVSEYLAIPTGWIIHFMAFMCWISAAMLLTMAMYRACKINRSKIVS